MDLLDNFCFSNLIYHELKRFFDMQKISKKGRKFHPMSTYRQAWVIFFPIANTLTHSHTMTPLMPLGNKPFENTGGKGEIARHEQFLLFPQCFLPVWITLCCFSQI